MKHLYLPDNIKVHFAGLENMNFINAISEMGVNYGLYSAFPFIVGNVISGKKKAYKTDVPKELNKRLAHVIQDSGLYSLLFGAHRDKASRQIIYRWYDALVEFTSEHSQDVTCVEVDAQAIIGVEETWRMRERIKKDLPNNRIINVFHIEDGFKGLDRMIEFSDYIAIGSGVTHNNLYTKALTQYIKNRKKSIDIHLLGCTTISVLKDCNFCTSSDSITWKSPLRFGRIGEYHISDLDTNKIKNMVTEGVYNAIRERASETSANAFCASIELSKRIYEINAGNQDYKKTFSISKNLQI